MTPIAQLIAELRELAKRGAALSDQLMDMYADPHIDNLTFSAAKHIARLEAAMLSAAEALARQEELLAEAGDSITPFANFAADNTVDDASGWAGGIWAGNRCERERIVDWFGPSDFRAAARLSDKLKGE